MSNRKSSVFSFFPVPLTTALWDSIHLDEKYPNILISRDLVVQDLVMPLVLTHDTEY